MDLKRHPSIPKHEFESIISNFNAIENSLSLYFTNHTSPPEVCRLLDQASQYARKRITQSDLENILGICPMYEISETDGRTFINFNNDTSRKEKFQVELDNWIEKNQDNKLPKSPVKSPSKVTKPRSASNSPKKKFDLKNDPSKFKYQEKTNSSNMSLLERIKLKEKLKKEQEDDPEEKYEVYLLGKVPMVYDAIYQLYTNQHESFKSFSVFKLTQIIQDSSKLPIDKEEIVDIMKLIESNLSNFKIVEMNNVKVLKVNNLSREKDLNMFKYKYIH